MASRTDIHTGFDPQPDLPPREGGRGELALHRTAARELEVAVDLVVELSRAGPPDPPSVSADLTTGSLAERFDAVVARRAEQEAKRDRLATQRMDLESRYYSSENTSAVQEAIECAERYRVASKCVGEIRHLLAEQEVTAAIVGERRAEILVAVQCRDQDEIVERIRTEVREATQLREKFLGVGRWLYRSEITQHEETAARLREARNEVEKVTNLEPQSNRLSAPPLERLLDDIQYRSITTVERAIREQRHAVDRLFYRAESQPLPPEVRRSLERDEVTRVAAEITAPLGQREDAEELQAKVRAILTCGLELSPADRVGYRFDGEASPRQTLEIQIKELPAELHYGVGRAVDGAFGYQREQWQRAWSWFSEHPQVADRREIDASHHRIRAALAALPSFTEYEQERFADALTIPMVGERRRDDRSGGFTADHDPGVVGRFISDAGVQSYLGGAFVERGAELLRQEVFDRFIESPNLQKEERIRVGDAMMQSPLVEAIPLVLLNAFAEPGYSGEAPFRGNPAHERDIARYLAKLTEIERGAVRELGIPGLDEAVTLIEGHPATYATCKVLNSRGESVPNEVHHRIQRALFEVADHLIGTGDVKTQRFAAAMIGSIDAPLTTQVRETLGGALRSEDSRLVEICGKVLLERIRYSRDIEAARLLLDRVPEEPRSSISFTREHGFQIARALIQGELLPGDAEKLGKVIDAPAEDVAVVHGFVRELCRSHHFALHGASLSEDFQGYLTAASLPGAREALAALGRYGYVFQSRDLPVLPELIKNYSGIVAAMDRIREYHPVFMYDPVRWTDRIERSERFTLDPYAGLVMRYSAEGVIDLLRQAQSSSGIDPLLVRAAYGAWRSREGESLPEIRAVDDVPQFFTDNLEGLVQESRLSVDGRISVRGAVLAHPMGQRLLARDPAWAQEIVTLSQNLERLAAGNPARARDSMYLVLDVLEYVDTGATVPPLGVQRWGEFVARARGQGPGLLYHEGGRVDVNASPVLKGTVGTLRALHPFLMNEETRTRIEAVLGGNADRFNEIVTGLKNTFGLMRSDGEVVALTESLFRSAERLGAARESVFDGALPIVEWCGWQTSVEEFDGVLRRLEDIAAQGLASTETWETIRGLYEPARQSPLLSSTPRSDGARELAIMTEYIKNHGAIVLPTLFGAFHRCMEERPFSAIERRTYGVASTGKRGLAELRERAAEVRGRLLEGDGPVDLSSALDIEMVGAQSRFHTSQWQCAGQTLEGRLRRFNESWSAGRIEPVSAGFKEAAGRSYRVERLDARALDSFAYAEDALAKLGQFRGDIVAVHGRALATVFQTLQAQLREGISERILDLSRPLSVEEQEKDKLGKRAKARVEEAARWSGFEKRIAEENNLVGLVKAIAAFERKDDPLTTPVLRRALVRLGLEQIGGGGEILTLATEPTSRGVIARMAEFYGGIIRSDVMRSLDLSEHQAMRAGSAVNVKALTAELARIEGLATAGTDVIGLLPTRGILGELSGFVCDACWTKEIDILEQFPHVTTVVFVRGPGTPTERLIGATLVMKVRSAPVGDEPGEDVFVIRGFNPLQNSLNTIKADQMFEGFVDWLKGVARAEGVTKIVIPGGAVGGSQTNRPSIGAHVTERYGSAPIVPLSSEVPTIFNGYSISKSCVLVATIEPHRGAETSAQSAAGNG